MNLVASLPWYDIPDCRNNLDRFWSVLRSALAQQGVAKIPSELDRSTPLAGQWANPGLVLSQCCGPDLFTPAAEHLVAIARPVFTHLDCNHGDYFSYIVSTRSRPAHEVRIVVNSPSSHSGCAVLLHWLSAQSLTCAKVLVSGSHQQSLQWLRDGKADLAAIDAQSWKLINPRDVSIIDRTPSAPAPPYVHHPLCPVTSDQVIAALELAMAQAGHLLGITGIVATSRQTYQVMRSEADALLSGACHLPFLYGPGGLLPPDWDGGVSGDCGVGKRL